MRSDDSSGQTPNERHTEQAKTYQFPLAGRGFRYAGQYFCSRSEAACAALMQKYIDYKIKDGFNFQVCIGENHRGAKLFVDYVVRNVVFEYHPIQKPKDPQYWRLLQKYPAGERDKFRDAWNNNEAQDYYDKRRAQLNANPKFKDMELVVARSPEEFFEKILMRFMQIDRAHTLWSIPACRDVLREFRRIQGAVQELGEQNHARHIRVRYRRAA